MSSRPTYAYKAVPASPEDAPGFVDCNARAFKNNALNAAIRPAEKAHLTTPEEWRAYRIRETGRRLAGESYNFKVVDPESGRLIGYSGWYAPGFYKNHSLNNVFSTPDGASEQVPGNDEVAPNGKGEELPACMDGEFYQSVIAKLDSSRREIWGDDTNFWYLGSLGVDPDYQRRGIATLLMQFGLDKADEEGVPIYLEGTPEGQSLYPKSGFEKVRETPFFDSKHVDVHYIRQPKPRQ